jgi:hypothetical protein
LIPISKFFSIAINKLYQEEFKLWRKLSEKSFLSSLEKKRQIRFIQNYFGSFKERHHQHVLDQTKNELMN